MPIDTQCIGQTPGIQVVGFSSTGGLSIPIALRTFGVNRVNGRSTRQELLDGRTLASLNGYSQVRVLLNEFFPVAPTFGSVFKG